MLKPLNCISYIFACLSIINISFCQEADYRDRLYRAIRDGLLEEVKSIVSLHPDALNGQLYTHNRDRKTPLHCAAEFDQVAILEFLVKAGGNINSRGVYTCTPLAIAIQKGHINSVKYLVEAGADTKSVGTSIAPYPALIVAITSDQFCIAEYFIDADAHALRKPDFVGNTPLHRAVCFGGPAIVQRLLTAGAEIEARNAAGETPLHAAVSSGRHSMVTLLLTQDAHIYAKAKNSHSPLEQVLHETWQALCMGYSNKDYMHVAEAIVKFGLSIDQTTAQELERQHVPYQQWIREKNDELREVLKNTDAADLPRDLQRFLLTFILSRIEP